MVLSRAVFWNTLSILSILLSAKIVRIVGFFIIASILRPDEVGQLSTTLACVEVVTGLSDFGVDLVAIRKLAQETYPEPGRVISASILAKILLSTFAYVLAVGEAFVLGFGRSGEVLCAIAGLSLFARSITNSLSSAFQAKLDMSGLVRVNFVSGVFYLGSIAIVLWLIPSVLLIVLMIVAADFLLLVLTFRTATRKLPLTCSFDWSSVKNLIVDGAPLGVSMVFVTAYFRLDTLILRKLVGLVAVGVYSVAYRATESFLLFATAYSNSIYPVFSVRAQRGMETLREPFRKGFCPVIAFMSMVALSVSTYVEPLMIRVAPKYVSSGLPIAILIWSTVFMFANAITGITLNSLGWHRLFIRITAVSFLMNLGFNVVLIPKWKILGASVATVATEVANFIQQSIALRKVTGIGVHLVWALVVFAAGSAWFLHNVFGCSPILFVLFVLPLASAFHALGYSRSFLTFLRLTREFDAHR